MMAHQGDPRGGYTPWNPCGVSAARPEGAICVFSRTFQTKNSRRFYGLKSYELDEIRESKNSRAVIENRKPPTKRKHR
jgi:hypothetical protein